jgi:hypothetical protein
LTIPLSVRDIWQDDSTSAENKVEEMKWLNEFTHRVQNIIADFHSSSENNIVQNLSENIEFYSKNSTKTKASVAGILKLGYEKTMRIPEKTFKDYSTEYLVFHQALNEVCNGAYALPEWEFTTLMGVTRKEALKILNIENDLWSKEKDN